MFKFGRATREYIAKELTDLFKKNSAAVIVNFQNVAVNKMQGLRKPLNAHAAKFRIVKNSMARIAAKNAKMDFLVSMFEGTCGIGFCDQADLVDISKAFVNFSKENEGFNISGGYFIDEFIPCDRIKELAMLPSKQALLTRAVRDIQSPISGFVGVLNDLVSGLVRVVEQIGKKRQT